MNRERESNYTPDSTKVALDKRSIRRYKNLEDIAQQISLITSGEIDCSNSDLYNEAGESIARLLEDVNNGNNHNLTPEMVKRLKEVAKNWLNNIDLDEKNTSSDNPENESEQTPDEASLMDISYF